MDSKTVSKTATARTRDIPVSTKQSIEIARQIRYKKIPAAKLLLEQVASLDKPIPYSYFVKDIPHRKGIGPGRFPQKAAQFFLTLLRSVEANAIQKGLQVESLKITKVIANRAPVPGSGGRKRRGTKRTHLEVEVKEVSAPVKKEVKKETKQGETK